MRDAHYLLAVARARPSSGSEGNALALAWIDISTGEFRITECDCAALSTEIARLEPGEILVSDALFSEADLAAYWRSLPAVTPLARDGFDSARPPNAGDVFSCGGAGIEGFGRLRAPSLRPLSAIVNYLGAYTARQAAAAFRPPVGEQAGAVMAIDQATRETST